MVDCRQDTQSSPWGLAPCCLGMLDGIDENKESKHLPRLEQSPGGKRGKVAEPLETHSLPTNERGQAHLSRESLEPAMANECASESRYVNRCASDFRCANRCASDSRYVNRCASDLRCANKCASESRYVNRCASDFRCASECASDFRCANGCASESRYIYKCASESRYANGRTPFEK